MLKSVFFKINGGYAKAIVDEKHIDFFTGLGAVLTQAEVVPKEKKVPKPVEKSEPSAPEPKKIKSKGDAGTGKPDSFEFYRANVLGFDSMESIKDYVQTVTGKTMLKSRRSTLETFQRKALSTIRKFLDGSQSG